MTNEQTTIQDYYKALLDECEPYLKENETPSQCIERNRNDWVQMVATMQEVTARAQTAEALLDEVAEEAEQAQELNMGNYDEDQVRDLNNFLIAVHAILAKRERSK